ncbi:hypothetical protein PoB_004316800 [Plakobranchus ocellatus]|uniref:Uncharacterized protein n=1 Tax=Plakobranchus ocellatus TaxID=259542 RepID=A0AAV4BCQ4_9GAST|nr:hypothetical protein PoB_004316800 [Plakobranchus ocellatus]
MADRNLWEDFVSVDINESGEVIDSEESDREMGEVTFHDLQPVALISQDESDADSDSSGRVEVNIEEDNPASDLLTSKEGTELRSTPLSTDKTLKKNKYC